MSSISTHILNTATGTPASGVHVNLSHLNADKNWEPIAEGFTNDDGRIPGLVPEGLRLKSGTYRLHFATGDYFQMKDTVCFHPFIEVVFVFDENKHHHVPLLLSPFGYSTYRGS